VERLNGVPNAVSASGPLSKERPDFERFLRIAELLQAVQDRELAAVRKGGGGGGGGAGRGGQRAVPGGGGRPAAAVEATKNGLEYRPREDGKTWVLVRPERRLIISVSPGAETSPEMTELEGLLNLTPGRKTHDIVVAARGGPDPLKFPSPPSEELRIVPRSTAQVLFYMSNGVEVPAAHVCNGLVPPSVGSDGQPYDPGEITRGLFAVHACKGHKPPPHAYVAVRYRDHWYYIDERDQDSKANFALVFHLGRLDFARQTLNGGPTLTLPVGK